MGEIHFYFLLIFPPLNSLIHLEINEILGMRLSQAVLVEGTQVRSLCWEDLLEEEMETHSSNLAWRIAWTEEPGGLRSMGQQSWARLSN